MSATPGDNEVRIRVHRQDSPDSNPYWDEFHLEVTDDANVITCLQQIQREPTNARGQEVAPVVWDCSCLEEVCGACTMVINGKVRQSCTALVKDIGREITLEPAATFPVVRDLKVDRSRMFKALKKVKAWVEVDGYHDLGPGPRIPQKVQEKNYTLSTCMTCGCCLEACPQVNPDNEFVGPSALAQVNLFNSHPTGAFQADARLDALQEEGGIAHCANAQNCVEVCPKDIPLTESIASVNRQMTKKLFRDFLGM